MYGRLTINQININMQ